MIEGIICGVIGFFAGRAWAQKAQAAELPPESGLQPLPPPTDLSDVGVDWSEVAPRVRYPQRMTLAPGKGSASKSKGSMKRTEAETARDMRGMLSPQIEPEAMSLIGSYRAGVERAASDYLMPFRAVDRRRWFPARFAR